MEIKIGIVGLPNVGKSTLFNALTKKSVPAENYPFCTIDPSVGVVPVPDERLWKLGELSQSKKIIPAIIEFVDIAGLVKGASEGEGLGNKFLQNIREVDAIAEVVRIFEDPDVIHVHNKVDPLGDIEVINLELVLADRETISKRLENLSREVKKGDKKAILEEVVCKKIQEALDLGKLASSVSLNEEEIALTKSLHLLTMKPILYVLNSSEVAENKREILNKVPGPFVEIDGVFGKGFDDLIKKSYETLGLETYFTTGEQETRAWTIKKNSTAPVAGAAIHTDFREKFIRAEVVASDVLLSLGSFAKARESGKLRVEGKEYVVKDGDVIEFRV